MVRAVPALLMLLSHMFSMSAPVLLVQCVERDGSRCIQTVIQQCQCCKEHTEARLAECPNSSETCCSGDNDDCDHHSSKSVEADESNPIVSDKCGCRHSQLAMDNATPTSGDSHVAKLLKSVASFSPMLLPAVTTLASAENSCNSLLHLNPNSAAPLRALSSTILRC